MTEQETREAVYIEERLVLDKLHTIQDYARVNEIHWMADGAAFAENVMNMLRGEINQFRKAQEPRVLTLDELRLIGNRNPEHIWPLGTPPYLWMEINPYFRRSNGFWAAWRDVWEMLTNVNPTFVADNYDKLWRCFAIKPTENQVKDLKWERRVTKK